MTGFAPVVPSYRVAGIDIAAITACEAATLLVAASQRGERAQVHLCNVYTISLTDRDDALREALESADLNLPDGAPVAWMGLRSGVRSPIRGPSLVSTVTELGAHAGIRHYFYGGAPGVADELTTRLSAEVPGLYVAGAESPPYGAITDEALAELARRIHASRAGIVWIGLGTPRQDHLVPRLAALVDAVIVPVGAAFDFLSGRIAEAPTLLQGSGFEWLYRLVREPKRLWRRYLIESPRFLSVVVRHRSS